MQSVWAAHGAAATGRLQSTSLLLFALWVFPAAATASPAPRTSSAGPPATFAAPGPRTEPIIAPSAINALRQGGPATLWVYFTDKGEVDAASFARAVAQAGARVPSASRVRRARLGGGRFTPDYSDVPTLPRYVEGVESTGARIRHVSRWLNAVSVEVDEAVAGRIAALPYVRRVTPVMRTELEHAPPGDYGQTLTQNQGIHAVAAHDSGYSAAGIVVAVFDTGFRKDHLALAPLKRIAEWDFVESDGETSNQPGDDPFQWNHGTGVWSILGGYLPGLIVGPAFNASFILAKTKELWGTPAADEDQWVAAAQWADSIGVDIVSTSMVAFDSYGAMDGQTTGMAQATNILTRHGILVVVAMGNSGPSPGTLWTPADCDSILSVGSVDQFNVISDFSARGPTFDGRGKPDLVAQGMNTIWADPNTVESYGSYPGTSLATPLVSGAAALVLEAHPEWTSQQVRYALKSTADRASTPDSTTYGWGRPDIVKAIYQSSLGGPIFPKPFALVAPTAGASIAGPPVTFRWRRSVDLNPGDVVSYGIQLKKVTPNLVVFTTSTPDTFVNYAGALDPGTLYEWNVVATDLAAHARSCAEPFRFTTAGAPPSIEVHPDTTGVEGSPITLTATSTDPEASETLTMTATGVPASLSFSHTPSASPATAMLSGTLTQADGAASPHTIVWSVNDGLGGTASDTTILHVNNVTGVTTPDETVGPPRVVHFTNRPNPFQSSTHIEFRMAGRPATGQLTLRIYDVRGRLVRTLLEGPPRAAATIPWDGVTESGERAGSGVYYYRLDVGETHQIRRLVLLK